MCIFHKIIPNYVNVMVSENKIPAKETRKLAIHIRIKIELNYYKKGQF